MEKETWTLKTLEIYLGSRIDSLQKIIDAALESMNKRLESMNEFRQTLSDQRLEDEKNSRRVEDTFVSKQIYDIEHQNLKQMMIKSDEALDKLITKNNEILENILAKSN